MRYFDVNRYAGYLVLAVIFLVSAVSVQSQNCGSCNITITPNPSVDVMCDPVLKVTMILDESGSIVGNGPGAINIANAVRDGALTFLNQLVGSTIQVRIIEFNSQARLAVAYRTVTTGSIQSGGIFHRYLFSDSGSFPSNDHYDPEDYTGSHIFTNWEGAMQKAHDGGAGDLVVFFTDGNPTARCLNSSCTDFETRTPVCEALAEGEVAAETIKAAGTRIVGIGYPNEVLIDCNVSAVSGSNKFNLGEDILTQADYIEVTNNDQLIHAFEMIGGALTVPCVISSDGSMEEATICASTNITLSVNDGEANANWSYLWNDPSAATTQSIQVTPSASTTYRVTVTDQSTNCSQVCSFRVLTEYCCEAPTLVCPPALINVSCDESPSAQASTETENGVPECPGYSIKYSETSHPGPCGGTYTRTWQLQFQGQTIEQCSQTVNVSAAPEPSATAPANTVMECSDAAPTATELFFTNGLSGPCGVSGMVMGVIVGSHDACGGSYAETWTFAPNIQCNSNPIVVSRIISVAPGIAATINCDVGNDLVLECGNPDQDDVISEWLAQNESAILATASSPCGVEMSISNTFQPSILSGLRCDQDRAAIVGFTVTDACGRSVSCTKEITLEDNTAPVWSAVPEDDSIPCATPLSEIPWPQISATDACSGDRIVTHSATTGELSCAGSSVIRTYTAVDNCGNRAEMSYTIHLVDEVPPVIMPPADLTISCSTPIPPESPIVTDDCSEFIEVTVTEERVATSLCEFDLIRTWTATDECGNVAVASQTISFRDLLPPQISLVPEFASLLDEDGNMHIYGCDMPQMLSANAIVTDDCCFIPSNLLPFDDVVAQNICDIFGYHTHYRCGYDYIDVAGHTARLVFDVFQYDTVAPVIHNMPDDITISCGQSIIPSASVEIFATDNCDAELDILFSESTVINPENAREASIIRTWTFVDDCGNSVATSQTLNVCDLRNSTRGSDLPNEYTQLDERTHMSEGQNDPMVGLIPNKSKFSSPDLVESLVEIAPNPTRGRTMLLFNSDQGEDIQISVFDHLGTLISENTHLISVGKNEITLDLSSAPSGMYSILLRVDEQQVAKRLLKN